MKKKRTPMRAQKTQHGSLTAINKNLSVHCGGLMEALSHSLMMMSNQQKTIALLRQQSAALSARIAKLERKAL